MTLRIQINCYCQYKCQCKPIPETKVTKQQIAYNLIRCNPALARYFSKTLVSAETVIQNNQSKRESPKPYRSIVQQKNLNILLADKHPVPQVPKKEDVVQIKINNFIDGYAQTSPKNIGSSDKKNQQKPKKNPTQQQIRQYYRQLKQTSRYLPNTAFKKYFNRPIFQNYGRQNTKGTTDGIIYGNYLKTHNINPHVGENRPHDEQTFYHALISASPQKLIGSDQSNLIKQQKGRGLSLSRLNQNQSLQKPLKRHDNNPDVIIMDNIHQHNKLNTISQMRVSPKSINSPKINKKTPQKYFKKESPIKISKSPKANEVKPNNINAQYVNQKQHIQRISHNIVKQDQKISNSPRNNQYLNIQNKISMRKNSPKNDDNKCPVDVIRQNHKQHILSKECNVKKQVFSNNKVMKSPNTKKGVQKINFGPGSPKVCNCKSVNGAKGCTCMSNVKKQLKQKAQKDIELNNRLITSARKASLYKNYGLNNGQNAKLDPHNYNECDGKIYEK